MFFSSYFLKSFRELCQGSTVNAHQLTRLKAYLGYLLKIHQVKNLGEKKKRNLRILFGKGILQSTGVFCYYLLLLLSLLLLFCKSTFIGNVEYLKLQPKPLQHLYTPVCPLPRLLLTIRTQSGGKFPDLLHMENHLKVRDTRTLWRARGCGKLSTNIRDGHKFQSDTASKPTYFGGPACIVSFEIK